MSEQEETPPVEMGSAPWEEPAEAEEDVVLGAPTTVPDLVDLSTVAGSITPPIDGPAVVDEVEALAEPVIPTTDIKFPHDTGSEHAIDSQVEGTTITKTSAHGYRVDGPTGGVDGNPIVESDALAHLPVGAQVIVGVTGTTKAMVVLPETAARATVIGFGARFHEALAQVWAWLVAEGHAVTP